MKFEEKKFCQIRTLAERWDCSPRKIYYMIEQGSIQVVGGDRRPGQRGLMISVQSVLEYEKALLG